MPLFLLLDGGTLLVQASLIVTLISYVERARTQSLSTSRLCLQLIILTGTGIVGAKCLLMHTAMSTFLLKIFLLLERLFIKPTPLLSHASLLTTFILLSTIGLFFEGVYILSRTQAGKIILLWALLTGVTLMRHDLLSVVLARDKPLLHGTALRALPATGDRNNRFPHKYEFHCHAVSSTYASFYATLSLCSKISEQTPLTLTTYTIHPASFHKRSNSEETYNITGLTFQKETAAQKPFGASIRTNLERILDTLSPAAADLFLALILGLSSGNNSDDVQLWGISHTLARSGLHLALFAALGGKIFGAIPLGLVIFLVLYGTTSYNSPSFERAYIFFFLCAGSVLLRRPLHSTILSTVTAISTLIINPLFLFSISWQLSTSLAALLLHMMFL